MTSSSFLANALHLQILPSLRTLTHRRQLLGKIQEQFGDVLVYKSLCVRPPIHTSHLDSNQGQYDKNLPRDSALAALIIFRNHESYRRMKAAGEIKFALDDTPFDPYALHWNLHPDAPPAPAPSSSASHHRYAATNVSTLPRQAPASPSPNAALSTALLSAAAATSSSSSSSSGNAQNAAGAAAPLLAPEQDRRLVRDVTVRATRWRGNHERYLEHTPFWGKFRVDASMMQSHLAKRVPMLGLSDVAVQRPSKPQFLVKERASELKREPALMELYELSKREGGPSQNS